MHDTRDSHVQIDIRYDNKALWVNVDGACVARITDPKSIEVLAGSKTIFEFMSDETRMANLGAV